VNLHVHYILNNFETFVNISGKFRNISGNITFPKANTLALLDSEHRQWRRHGVGLVAKSLEKIA